MTIENKNNQTEYNLEKLNDETTQKSDSNEELGLGDVGSMVNSKILEDANNQGGEDVDEEKVKDFSSNKDKTDSNSTKNVKSIKKQLIDNIPLVAIVILIVFFLLAFLIKMMLSGDDINHETNNNVRNINTKLTTPQHIQPTITKNELLRKKEEHSISPNKVNESWDGEMEFDENGNIINKNVEVKEEPKKRTIKEILASAQLSDLTDDQLNQAYQILDQQQIQVRDSLLAIEERMKEKGMPLPLNSLELQIKNRDLQIYKNVTAELSKQWLSVLAIMNNNIQDLNHNQLILKTDIEKNLQELTDKINVENIKNTKKTEHYNELTNANKILLNKYKIETILNNRVWLKQAGINKTLSYTVGDHIGNGIIIEHISKDNNLVRTNKGDIQ